MGKRQETTESNQGPPNRANETEHSMMTNGLPYTSHGLTLRGRLYAWYRWNTILVSRMLDAYLVNH